MQPIIDQIKTSNMKFLMVISAICAVTSSHENSTRDKRGWGYEATTQSQAWIPPTRLPPPMPPPKDNEYSGSDHPPERYWEYSSNGWNKSPPPESKWWNRPSSGWTTPPSSSTEWSTPPSSSSWWNKPPQSSNGWNTPPTSSNEWSRPPTTSNWWTSSYWWNKPPSPSSGWVKSSSGWIRPSQPVNGWNELSPPPKGWIWSEKNGWIFTGTGTYQNWYDRPPPGDWKGLWGWGNPNGHFFYKYSRGELE